MSLSFSAVAHCEVDLSEVLPPRGVVGRELRGFRGGVQCLGELAQPDVSDAQRFPRQRIERLLARPFGRIDDEQVPIAFLLERLNFGKSVIAHCVGRLARR